jgi:predicted hotdog family 3-hydroxylacyl-ACP dehydratase
MIIMLVDKNVIKNYIPQREPFIMIDNLLSVNETTFTSTFEIIPENIFLSKGILSEAALVENIAQTCAAGFGYLGTQSGETESRLGFIGAVSKLEVLAESKVNDCIDTTVTVLNRFENIYLIEGVATSSGTELLRCQMKIVRA